MKIGFDLDGVIIDHTFAKIKLATDLGFNIAKKDTPSEILKTILPKKNLDELQKSLYGKNHAETSLLEGSKKVIQEIVFHGLPFFLISRRNPGIFISAAIRFLKKEDLWPKYFNEINSFFVVEKEDKDMKAKELGITHYFDDELSVLEKLKSVENKFLFDNHGVFPKGNFYKKVSSWDDIKKQLHL